MSRGKLARFAIGVFAVPVLVCATHALAVELKTSPAAEAGTSIIEIMGQFGPGDGLKVRAELSKVPADQAVIAHLNAGGGLTSEAMSIGRLFHRSGVKTVIPPKARCVAPCPLLFVAGFDRRKNIPSMLKHSTGSMGVTAYTSSRKEQDYTFKDVDTEIAATQRSILLVADYLQEIGADVDFMKLYFKPAKPSTTNWISDDELLDMGASIYDDSSNQVIDGMALKRRAQ